MISGRMKHAGLTLLELLITISILAIILGVAVPSFFSTIEKHRADVAISKIYHMYQLGREYAVSERKHVYFCGSESLTDCDREWKNNLILFVDEDGDRTPSFSEIIYTDQLDIDQATILTRIAFGRSYTILAPDGTAKLTGSMVYCPDGSNTKFADRVTWNNVGRPYKGIDRNGDGFKEDTDGSPILCL